MNTRILSSLIFFLGLISTSAFAQQSQIIAGQLNVKLPDGVRVIISSSFLSGNDTQGEFSFEVSTTSPKHASRTCRLSVPLTQQDDGAEFCTARKLSGMIQAWTPAEIASFVGPTLDDCVDAQNPNTPDRQKQTALDRMHKHLVMALDNRAADVGCY